MANFSERRKMLALRCSFTGDKNLSFQQDLRGIQLALVVLSTNNWNVLKHHCQAVLEAVDAATPGSFHVVQLGSLPYGEA
jgi:hypothetical protein